MRKRRIYVVLLILAVAGLVGLIVAGAFRQREPEYGGKSLSEWLKKYPDLPHPAIGGAGDEAADDAIRHMGTNAFPLLLKWMQYQTPTWKYRLYGAINPVLKRLNSSWALNEYGGNDVLANRALQACVILSPNIKGAAEDLARLLNAPKSKGALRAMLALKQLGTEGYPGLVLGLTNRQAYLRGTCAYFISETGSIGTNGAIAVPALQELLKDSDAYVRAQATNALHKIDPTALERAAK